MVRNMTNEQKFEIMINLKDNIEKMLSKEETQALWKDIFDNFEGREEVQVRNFIRKRFDFLKTQILSKIEEINKHIEEINKHLPKD